MKTLHFSTTKKQEILDITPDIKQVLSNLDIKEGLCNIYTPHATAAVTVNENDDPNITLDIIDALDKLIPQGIWRHDQIDNNAAAHIKASIMGPSETIPIKNNSLVLGTWQNIFLCCFDGPKDRKVIITLIKN